MAPAYMKLVCLFLSRCALRLFFTSLLMDGGSNGIKTKKNTEARRDSVSPCMLIANIVSPMKSAIKIMKKTCKSRPKFMEMSAKGMR